MHNMKMIVTGSNGLIGSEIVRYFNNLGCNIHGIDNNMRADFFGPQGDTRWNQRQLEADCKRFQHVELDIRNRESILECFRSISPDAVIHAAAQPSHDLA